MVGELKDSGVALSCSHVAGSYSAPLPFPAMAFLLPLRRLWRLKSDNVEEMHGWQGPGV